MGPIPDARSVFRQLRRVQLAKEADGSQNWARIGPIWGMPESVDQHSEIGQSRLVTPFSPSEDPATCARTRLAPGNLGGIAQRFYIRGRQRNLGLIAVRCRGTGFRHVRSPYFFRVGRPSFHQARVVYPGSMNPGREPYSTSSTLTNSS